MSFPIRYVAISILTTLITFHVAISEPLTDDFPRAYLGNFAAGFEPGWQDKALPRPFRFPDHAREGSIFGVDVSHYEGKIDWASVPDQKVLFAYVKATQSDNLVDSRFTDNWRGIAAAQRLRKPIYKGAYHFMSADKDPVLQAKNFLRVLGNPDPNDLPATLDLEWDLKRDSNGAVMGSDGKPGDMWASHTPDDIIKRIGQWLNEVEKVTKKKTVIYTNYYWWADRVGSSQDFASNPLWIADYASRTLGSENPKVPAGRAWALWQFTDFGGLNRGGISGRVDVSEFKGTTDQFYATFGLPPEGQKRKKR